MLLDLEELKEKVKGHYIDKSEHAPPIQLQINGKTFSARATKAGAWVDIGSIGISMPFDRTVSISEQWVDFAESCSFRVKKEFDTLWQCKQLHNLLSNHCGRHDCPRIKKGE
jgi:hypothetical protein